MAVSFDSVILQLFESLLEKPPWESFLRLMEGYLDCRSCALLLRTPTQDDSGLVISERLGPIGSPMMIEAFYDSPFLHDPDGKVMVLSQMMSEEEFRKKHRAHYEYNKRVATVDLMSLTLTNADTGAIFRFHFIRSENESKFGSEDVKALEACLPYLKTAVGLYGLIVHQRQQLYISDQTSSRLGIGVVVLDTDGYVMTINPVADSILKSEKAFFIRQGRLHCSEKSGERNLRDYLRAVKNGISAEKDASFQVRWGDGSDKSWQVMLRKNEIPPEFRQHGAEIISVLLKDSHQKTSIGVERLIKVFDLTPAEAQLTERLVQGESLTEAALSLGRSRSTVRVQLAAVFAKTGVHKQHQLISHILHTAVRGTLI